VDTRSLALSIFAIWRQRSRSVLRRSRPWRATRRRRGSRPAVRELIDTHFCGMLSRLPQLRRSLRSRESNVRHNGRNKWRSFIPAVVIIKRWMPQSSLRSISNDYARLNGSDYGRRARALALARPCKDKAAAAVAIVQAAAKLIARGVNAGSHVNVVKRKRDLEYSGFLHPHFEDPSKEDYRLRRDRVRALCASHRSASRWQQPVLHLFISNPNTARSSLDVSLKSPY